MNLNLKLERPLVFLDLESSGLDHAKDRIVSLAFLKLSIDSQLDSWMERTVNPGVILSEEVIACHGITNAMVADKPYFREIAHEVISFLKDCDLAGYNLLNFDVPLLWEELYRAGIEWDLKDVRVIDVEKIFKKKEERTLSAALQFYCSKEHEQAHTAMADVQATIDVFNAQIERYLDLSLMTIYEIHDFCKVDRRKRLDLSGKVLIDKNGDAVYGLKSKEGVRVKDDPGFARWMLDRDFPENTKLVLRQILDDLYEEERREFAEEQEKLNDFIGSDDSVPF